MFLLKFISSSKYILIFELILVQFVVLACSQNTKDRPSAAPSEPVKIEQSKKTISFDSQEKENEFLQQLEILCETCKPSTGIVTVKNKDGIALCAGVFLDGSTFVTNKHCLPTSLHIRGVDCSQDVTIYGRTDKTVKASCGTVIDLSAQESEATYVRPDFAILSLKENLEGIPILDSFAGPLSDGDIVQADFPSYENIKSRQVELKSQDCRVTKDSMINPYFVSGETSATYALSDCDFVPGQSGSPLYHDGMLYGLHSQRVIISSESEFARFNSEEVGLYARGTLHGCFTHILSNEESPEVCRQQYSAQRESAQTLEFKNKSYLPKNQERREIISSWLETNSEHLFYQFSSGQVSDYEREQLGLMDAMVTGIDCVRLDQAKINEELEQDIYKWNTFIHYNKYLQVSFSIESQKIWSHFQVTESGSDESALHLSLVEDEQVLNSQDFLIPWCTF